MTHPDGNGWTEPGDQGHERQLFSGDGDGDDQLHGVAMEASEVEDNGVERDGTTLMGEADGTESENSR